MSTKEGQDKLTKSIFDAFVTYKSYVDGVDYLITHSTKTEHNTETVQNIPENSTNQNEVIFRVQIETSSVRLAKDNPRFKGQNVFEYSQDGLYKYTVGAHKNDFESANKLKNELREKGFEFAFVVAFQGSERINLEKAIKLAKK